MKTYYSLRIAASENHYNKISELLGVIPNNNDNGWMYEVIEGKNDPHFNFIKEFTTIIEGKMKELHSLGIRKEDITVWMIYEYEGQCNMEFHPEDMWSLCKHGISLCVSCYEAGQG